MKEVTKEYFACKCIEQISNCKYIYEKQTKEIIKTIKEKFQITAKDISDTELETYIKKEIKEIFR